MVRTRDGPSPATVEIQSLPPATCPDPVGMLVTPAKFPITLAPKRTLTLKFLVTYDCANDPAATTKTAAHNDYATIATVHHEAIDGIADADPADDVCPHDPLGAIPGTNGKIVDTGCGGRNPDHTLGAYVLTDVVVTVKR